MRGALSGGQGGSMRSILFVDDHVVLARLSCEILEMNGYRAVPAYDAATALQLFGDDSFDIVVTDWRMDGMDGIELARAIHAQSPATPIILVTGYGPVEAGSEIAACLGKDRLFPELLHEITLLLGEAEAAEPELELPARSA